MPTLIHVHTYMKHERRRGYFRCAHPDCTHYIEKEILVGKRTCCTACGSEFILDRFDLQRAKPRCLSCSATKKARAHQLAQTVLGSIFKDTEEKE